MNEEKPLFEGMDELERTYAPQQLPEDDPEKKRVNADGTDAEDVASLNDVEPPDAAPVATVGTTPSGVMAPPNIGHEDHGGAPGDPQTEAGDPLDDEA